MIPQAPMLVVEALFALVVSIAQKGHSTQSLSKLGPGEDVYTEPVRLSAEEALAVVEFVKQAKIAYAEQKALNDAIDCREAGRDPFGDEDDYGNGGLH